MSSPIRNSLRKRGAAFLRLPEYSHERLALELACRPHRFWALSDLARAGAANLDPGKVRDEIAAARKLPASCMSIKGKITHIKAAVDRGMDELERELSKLRDGFSQAFDRLDACLAGTADM